MDRLYLILLEDDSTRYEFYMHPIRKSNVDNTIVRYELCYDYVHLCTSGTGSVRSTHNRLYKDFGTFIEHLLLQGFREVTFTSKKFA